MTLIFKALDILTIYHFSGLVFSTAIAASLIVFWPYAVLTIREKRTLHQLAGIVLTAAGEF